MFRHTMRTHPGRAFTRLLNLLTIFLLLISSSLLPAQAHSPEAAPALLSVPGVTPLITAPAPPAAQLVDEPSPQTPRASAQMGAALGQAVNAVGDSPLAGVLVRATGEGSTPGLILLPLISKGSANHTSAGDERLFLPSVSADQSAASAAPEERAPQPQPPPSGQTSAPVSVGAGGYSATTDSNGNFTLPLPSGIYTLTFTLDSFVQDQRLVSVQANQSTLIEPALVRLHPADPKAPTPIGQTGGTVTDTPQKNTLDVPADAVQATQQFRVTNLPTIELPGNFANGSAPLAFAAFEPDGLVFPTGKEATWTTNIGSSLPAGLRVGDAINCYWWDGKTGSWRDPVVGKVVALGNGEYGLQASLPHFTSYGYAAPPPPQNKPPVNSGNPNSTSPPNQGGNKPDQDPPPGELINLGVGTLAEEFALVMLPAPGLPVAPVLRHDTYNDTPAIDISAPFTLSSNSNSPTSQSWEIRVAGRNYTGQGYTAQASWDTRDNAGQRVAPGIHKFRATETFVYSNGSTWTATVTGTLEVRRGDLSPYGYNWMTAFDSLVVDRTDQAVLIDGDGRMLSFARNPDGTFTGPAGEFSRLVQNGDGSWEWTQKYGTVLSFNSLGRLTRIEDPNGNAISLAYESNGVSVPLGSWGLTTRLKTITDPAGAVWTLAYGGDNLASSLTDPTGQVYTFQHDTAGNLTRVTDPLGRSTQYAYDGLHRMTSRTDALGHTKSFQYDAQGRLIQRTDAAGGAYAASYDAAGATWTDERGNALRYTTNNFGAVTSVSGTDKQIDYTWTTNRQMASVASDPFVVAQEYDERGNIVRILRHDEVRLAHEPAFNRPISVTDGVGNMTRYTYDAQANLVGSTDPLGNQAVYAYDSRGQMSSFTDPAGFMTSYAYNGQGLLSRMTLPMGQAWQYGYSPAGALTSLTDPSGVAIAAYTYDAANRLTGISDALGGTTSFTYDGADNQTRFQDPNGVSTQFSYDALDRLTTVTLPGGGTVTYTYDPTSNVTGRTDARGKTTQYSYDTANRLTSAVFADGAVVAYTYDNAGDVTGTTGPWGTTSYDYNGGYLDNPATVVVSGTNGVPIQTTITYDYAPPGTTARAAQSSQPLDNPSWIEIGQSDLNGHEANGPRVLMAQVRPMSQAEQVKTRNQAQIPGHEVAISSQWPSTAWSTIDLLDGLVGPADVAPPTEQIDTTAIRQPAETAATTQRLAATPAWQPILYRLPWSVALDSPVDSRPERSQPTALDTNVPATVIVSDTTWTLAGSPYVLTGDVVVSSGVTLTVEPGVVVQGQDQVELQVQGHLSAIGTPTQPITFTSSTDSAPHQWTGLVFSGGTGHLRHASVYYAGGLNNSGLTDIYYGSNIAAKDVTGGELRIEESQIRNQNDYYGNRPDFGLYAANSRVVVSNTLFTANGASGQDYALYATGSAVVTVVGTRVQSNPGNGIGVLAGGQVDIQSSHILDNGVDGVYVSGGTARIDDSSLYGNQSYGVRNAGGPVVMAEHNWWGASSGPYHPTLNPSGSGNRVSDGVDFDPWKRISSLRYGLNIQTNSAAPLTVQYTYNPLNLVSSVTSLSPASFAYLFSYNANYRITGRGPLPGSPGVSTTVSYNANTWGTRLTHRSPDGGVTFADRVYSYDAAGNITSITDSGGTTNYAYDALYRLTKVTYPCGGSESYTYDAGGNRQSRDGIAYTYDGTNRLVSSTADGGTIYTYDANGNLTGKSAGGQTTAFTWNAQNQLARIDYPDGSHSAYTYDHRGRRLSKTDRTAVTVYFVYDGANLVQEVDAAGAVIAQYVYERDLDTPLSMTRGGVTYYYLSDHLGSIIGLTDGGGTLVASYTYDPWGNVTAQTGTVANPFRFSGREYDEESGLYFLRARYYDPTLGRFLSPDPLRLMGNGASYAYAANNPVNFVDPLGLVQWWRLGKSVLGMVGGAVQTVTGVGLLLAPEPTGLTKVGGVALTAKGAGDFGLSTANAWAALVESKADIPTGTFDAVAMGGSKLAGASKKTEQTVRSVAGGVDFVTGIATGRLAPTNSVLNATGAVTSKTANIANTVGDVNTGIQAVTSTGESAVTTYDQAKK